jgi:hypothetical protein
VSKKLAAKRAKIGTSQATPSKMMSSSPKMGPQKKIGVVKTVMPRARTELQGTSEIELALAKPVRVSKKFCLLDVVAPHHGPHHDSC